VHNWRPSRKRGLLFVAARQELKRAFVAFVLKIAGDGWFRYSAQGGPAYPSEAGRALERRAPLLYYLIKKKKKKKIRGSREELKGHPPAARRGQDRQIAQ
jgi:hypothetical protein